MSYIKSMDPELYVMMEAEAERQQENRAHRKRKLYLQSRYGGCRFGTYEQIRRGIPREALLWRL